MKRLTISTIFALVSVIAFSTIASADHRDRRVDRNRERIAIAAHQMDDAAKYFYRLSRNSAKYSHTTRDAEKLAEAAHHFHKAVERGTSYHHLSEDFHNLEYHYQQLRLQLYPKPYSYNPRHNRPERHAGQNRYYSRPDYNLYDRHIMQDWYQVERAWQQLYQSMGGGSYRYYNASHSKGMSFPHVYPIEIFGYKLGENPLP